MADALFIVEISTFGPDDMSYTPTAEEEEEDVYAVVLVESVVVLEVVWVVVVEAEVVVIVTAESYFKQLFNTRYFNIAIISWVL